MLDALLTRLVTIHRRTVGETTDEYGNAVSDTTTIVAYGELQQRTRRENPDEMSDTTWLLVLPVGTDIDTNDSVVVADMPGGPSSFELVGEPWPVRNPRTGAESHIEATLRRTAGGG